MKIDETDTTVTTLDTTLQRGARPRFVAVVATTERGNYVAGTPSEATRAAHRDALAKLLRTVGADVRASELEPWTQDTTRGIVTHIDLNVCAG